MGLAADLHIHSALSPCGNEDMTPNNLVNMAVLKGIDVISVTDHNTASNLPSINVVSLKNDILLLPGIEVQTREEVHMLCYFKSVDDAVEVGNYIYEKLPDIKNNEQLFGNQHVFDYDDNIIGSLDKLLISSADISIKQLTEIVTGIGGVCIPAHIDRSAYSIISNLGFIPKELNVKTVELSKAADEISMKIKYPFLNSLRIIKSSDAHYLCDISERENFLPIKQPALDDVLNFMKGI